MSRNDWPRKPEQPRIDRRHLEESTVFCWIEAWIIARNDRHGISDLEEHQ